jgi:hypothetical protein
MYFLCCPVSGYEGYIHHVGSEKFKRTVINKIGVTVTWGGYDGILSEVRDPSRGEA